MIPVLLLFCTVPLSQGDMLGTVWGQRWWLSRQRSRPFIFLHHTPNCCIQPEVLTLLWEKNLFNVLGFSYQKLFSTWFSVCVCARVCVYMFGTQWTKSTKVINAEYTFLRNRMQNVTHNLCSLPKSKEVASFLASVPVSDKILMAQCLGCHILHGTYLCSKLFLSAI